MRPGTWTSLLATLAAVLSLTAAGRESGAEQGSAYAQSALRVRAWKRILPPRPVRLRDPFAPLLEVRQKGAEERQPRPPGKAGLAVSELVVQGVVRGPDGAVAVVAGRHGHVYFLHPGDVLFDGRVVEITDSGVEFLARSVDAAGRVSWHRVTRRVESAQGGLP
jgi:hypothetical protein